MNIRSALHRLCRQRQHQPLIAHVRVDGRSFRVSRERQHETQLIGLVHPRRHQREMNPASVFGKVLLLPSETEMRFKLCATRGGRRGYITNITVVGSRQRQGWATSMIRALFTLYPDCIWTVECPNEQSGQLFQYLAQRYPQQVIPASTDPRYGPQDHRHYLSGHFDQRTGHYRPGEPSNRLYPPARQPRSQQ